jgi:hypothetical protein
VRAPAVYVVLAAGLMIGTLEAHSEQARLAGKPRPGRRRKAGLDGNPVGYLDYFFDDELCTAKKRQRRIPYSPRP